jgi:hypothetical protein
LESNGQYGVVKGKRGWQRRDISEYVGQRYGQLVILGRAESKDGSGNLRVTCRCDCGAEFDTRLAGIVSGKTGSCGHRRRETFLSYWNRKAEKLPADWVRFIFLRLCAGQWSDALASETGLDKRLIEGAFRVHAARLIEQYPVQPGEGLIGPRAAAKSYGLTLAEFLFLRRAARKAAAQSNEGLVISIEDARDILSDAWITSESLPLAT